MASKIIVDQLESSGSNITIPTGTGLVVTDGIAATNLSGTIADARLPTVPVTKGGTGLTSLGSAGQAVKVNSSGNALEFGAVAGGKVLQLVQETVDDAYSFTHTSFAEVNSAFRKSITPTANTSKILVLFSVHTSFNHSTQQVPAYYKIQRKIGSGSYADISLPSTNLGNRSACHFMQPNIQTGTGENCDHSTVTILDTPNTTQAVGYTILSKIRGTGSGFVNRMGNDTNDPDQSRYLAYWTFIEIGA
jgi:hypothetical protein